MTTSPLVSARDLAARLASGEAMTLLDVRYQTGVPDGRPAYLAGHVPGSVYVDVDEDLAAPPAEPGEPGGRHPLPTTEVFEKAMRRAGVWADRAVVVYDDWSGQAAARAWWLLRHYGHHDVRVLDGGWSAWRSVGGDVETGETQPVRGGFHGRPGSMGVVDAGGVPSVDVLVDARAPERYRGEVEPIDPVAGHIPGAVNVPTVRNLDNHGHFRDVHELREVYAAVGAVEGADVAAYCGSGVTAAHDVLALELVGVPAKLYPGSWSQWITDASRPVVTSGSP